jgi:hypothetical protein
MYKHMPKGDKKSKNINKKKKNEKEIHYIILHTFLFTTLP